MCPCPLEIIIATGDDNHLITIKQSKDDMRREVYKKEKLSILKSFQIEIGLPSVCHIPNLTGHDRGDGVPFFPLLPLFELFGLWSTHQASVLGAANRSA